MPANSAFTGTSTSSAGMLAPFTNELDRLAPSFKINGSQIQIIKSPTDFYETLKVLTYLYVAPQHEDHIGIVLRL